MSAPWNEYPWATNKAKLERAVNTLASSKEKFSEVDVKKLYISYGGLVKEEEVDDTEKV